MRLIQYKENTKVSLSLVNLSINKTEELLHWKVNTFNFLSLKIPIELTAKNWDQENSDLKASEKWWKGKIWGQPQKLVGIKGSSSL